MDIDAANMLAIRSPTSIDAQLRLHPGETQAISLAKELKADHVLMDEWAGRDAAQRLGLHVVGTVGILDQAAERNLVALPEMFDRLKKTSFRINDAILQALLDADAGRTGR